MASNPLVRTLLAVALLGVPARAQLALPDPDPDAAPETGQCQDEVLPPFDPDRPFSWVCDASLRPASQEEIDAWCSDHPDRGQPLPPALRDPPTRADLKAKNRYDRRLNLFARSEEYRRLGWKSDPRFRFSGPYVGRIPEGTGFGTHLPLRIFYSPEVVDWLCDGRQGELPDGAAMVKTMSVWSERLPVKLDRECCMEIDPLSHVTPVAWAIMVRSSAASFDGWYWPAVQRQALVPAPGQQESPPVFNRSGITRLGFFGGQIPPLAPRPEWYPTGFWAANQEKWPNVITPFQQYGGFCTSCHGVAESESTFASIDNLLGKSIRYKQFRGPDTPLQRFNHTWPGFVSSETGQPVEGADDPELSDPFTKPLPAPTPEFLAFYDQLGEVSFSRAWRQRLPAQTWDHVVSDPGGPSGFLTSDQCVLCHDAVNLFGDTSNMRVSRDDVSFNLSVSGEWSSSPMGLAGRDPIFFAQLQSETNHLPEDQACIENLCLHCHSPMGQRQFATDHPVQPDPCGELFGVKPPADVPTGEPFRLEMLSQWPGARQNAGHEYGGLARDGVSCTVCHRIAEDDLGTEAAFTGNFTTDPPDQMNGPYRVVSTAPMQGALGMHPRFARQVRSPELCTTCHNILLPVFRDDGEITGFSYEQTTGLEWRNSDYATGRSLEQPCQGCHMPTSFEGDELEFVIANFESSDFPPTTHRLPDAQITPLPRSRYARHTLHGLNIFLNEMVQQFPLLLGFRQGTFFPAGPSQRPSLLLTKEATIGLAQNETADVEITGLERTPDGLRVVVEVTNRAGHYIPSGVGFRRMFLEVVARDGRGRPLWASGRTNSLGAIVAGTGDQVLPSEQPVKFPDAPIQPHHEIIDSQDEVQIYQELVRDSAGQLTTSFLRRFEEVKDNRIRPKGYDPAFYLLSSSPFIQALARTPGRARLDPDYQDPARTGADVLEYRMRLRPGERRRVARVEVTLYNQSIPPSYLQQRFRDARQGARRRNHIQRLYYMASHLNVDDTLDADGRRVLSDWKLFVASDGQSLE